MNKQIAIAGALGVLVLGTVAIAQTTNSNQTQPNTSTTPMNQTRPDATPMDARNSSTMSGQNTTAQPYDSMDRGNMAGGAQTSPQEGSANQWAGERG